MNESLKWKLIPLFLLMLNAAWIVWSQFSVAGLVTAILVILILGIVCFRCEMKQVLLFSIYAALIVGLILPSLPIRLDDVWYRTLTLIDPIRLARSSAFATVYLIGYAIMLCLTYLIEKKHNDSPCWFAVSRIVLQTLLLRSCAQTVLWNWSQYQELIVLAGAIALIWDVQSCLKHKIPHGWRHALGGTVLFLVSVYVFDGDAGMVISRIRMQDGWLQMFLAVLAVGILILAFDTKQLSQLEKSPVWYLMAWDAVLLIMIVCPAVRSLWGLYLLFPLTALLVHILIDRINPYRFIGKRRTVLKCLLIVLMVLLQIRAERVDRFIAVVLLVLEAAGFAVVLRGWKSPEKRIRERQRQCWLGVAAVILNFAVQTGSLERLQSEPLLLLSAALCCFGWYLICQTEKMLAGSDTSLYPNEFVRVKKMMWYVPFLLLGGAVLRIFIG